MKPMLPQGTYLGMKVYVLDELKEGWLYCLFPNGKTYHIWADQVETN